MFPDPYVVAAADYVLWPIEDRVLEDALFCATHQLSTAMSEQRSIAAQALVFIGFSAMIAGILDPLEGSLVILAGVVLVTIGAAMTRSRHTRLLSSSLVFTAVGVSALWALSAVGGFGGTTGRSIWWGLALLPYPLGFIAAIVGAAKKLREGFGPAT